jgi:hypothetical protein
MKNYILSPKELRAKAIYSESQAKMVTALFFKLILIFLAILSLALSANAQSLQTKNFNNLDANGVILDG